jgi:hypothetical protein
VGFQCLRHCFFVAIRIVQIIDDNQYCQLLRLTKPAATGVCLVPIVMPSFTGHAVLAGIFNTDIVFKYALENLDCRI